MISSFKQLFFNFEMIIYLLMLIQYFLERQMFWLEAILELDQPFFDLLTDSHLLMVYLEAILVVTSAAPDLIQLPCFYCLDLASTSASASFVLLLLVQPSQLPLA